MTLPLKSLKVLDFSTLLPGPYASMMMADMGAEVLRIEAIGRHDLVKEFKPSIHDSSYAYLTLNRNKKAIALDLKQQEAIGLVKKLVAEYDIILEQFRPGVMAKLGLDYQTLKAINPTLIYCSITGYGQNGCYKNRAGHDINYLALSGLASFSGTQQTGPVLSGTQIADIAGGSHHAVMGIMAAVIARTNSGEGQHIDISMTDAAFSLTGMFGAGGVAIGESGDPTLSSTMLNGGHFYGYYKTSDDKYISIGSLEIKFAKVFFTAIKHPEWLERGFSTNIKDQQLLITDISAIIELKTLAQWMTIFEPLDACIEPVLTVSQAANSSLMNDRNMVIDVKVFNGETVKQIAPAIKFNKQSQNMFVNEPNNEDTYNLMNSLGYSDEKINQLISNNAVK